MTAEPTKSFPIGLWRRRSMTWPDGRTDTTTRVFWLQTSSIFADIRVPLDRHAEADRRSFAEMSDPALIDLARAQGFAGHLEVEDTICRWHRLIDFEPPGGDPDEAYFAIDGDVLTESGLHANYVEIWDRLTPPDADLSAFTLEGGSDAKVPAGYLVIAGDYFIEIRGRAKDLPIAKNLGVLVAAALAEGARRTAIEMLDMKICFGHVGANTPSPWTTTLSTLPWLENTGLFEGIACRFDQGTATLTVGNDIWRLIDSTAPACLPGLFEGSA